jgi:hypothetical protein
LGHPSSKTKYRLKTYDQIEANRWGTAILNAIEAASDIDALKSQLAQNHVINDHEENGLEDSSETHHIGDGEEDLEGADNEDSYSNGGLPSGSMADIDCLKKSESNQIFDNSEGQNATTPVNTLKAEVLRIPPEYLPWEHVGIPLTPLELKDQVDSLVERLLHYASEDGREEFVEAEPKSGVQRFTKAESELTCSLEIGLVEVCMNQAVFLH